MSKMKIVQGCALAAMTLIALAPVAARADRDDWHHSNRGHHYGWLQPRNPHSSYMWQHRSHNWNYNHRRDWDGDRDDRWRHRDNDDRWRHRDNDDHRNWDRDRDRDRDHDHDRR